MQFGYPDTFLLATYSFDHPYRELKTMLLFSLESSLQMVCMALSFWFTFSDIA